MVFEPEPYSQLLIGAQVYEVMPHPVVPSMAFGQEGRKATIYQLRHDGKLYALKIFKSTFRTPSLVRIYKDLTQLNLPGFEICQNMQIFTKSSKLQLLNTYPEMEYAMLMPWIKGSTWFDIIAASFGISKQASKVIAKNTARILADLEMRGYAHCDVAGGNVVIDTSTSQVNFIDVDDMYGPGFLTPKSLPQGTDGYYHRTSRSNNYGQWCATGDRFSAAVLLAEMFTWHDPKIRRAADVEHFFDHKELQDTHCARYQLMLNVLKSASPEVADCFERAWCSDTLEACPSLKEWAFLLEWPVVEWTPIKLSETESHKEQD